MKLLIYGSLLFISAFFLHFVVWRIHLPKRQTKILLFIFFSVLCVGSGIYVIFSDKITLMGYHPPENFIDYLRIWLFFISLTLAYTITYSAIEADSPSLLIVLKISETGQSGFHKDDLEKFLDDRVLIHPRVEDLLIDKMARIDETNRYRLTPKGIFMARLFAFYRSLLREGMGG